MKRREFLAAVAETSEPEGASPASSADQATGISPFANTSLPAVQRTTAGLEPYTGPWGADQILHLLRRTTFGPSHADFELLKTKSMFQAVDLLLTVPAEEVSAPLSYDARDTAIPLGSTWVNAVYRDPNNTTFDPSGVRRDSLKGWWTSLMLNQPLSIREKMVLFWHNHFVTEAADIPDPRYSYRYVALLRKNAMGNFKELARQITFDGAMLRYLNGFLNNKTAPDENYARELQELFTIGKGPQVGDGDYTNYTEQDVKAAAKVLTGWRIYQNPDGTVGTQTSSFDATRHDSGNKNFSYRYGNVTIIGGIDGPREVEDLLNMIFLQPETAKYICRKIYRWFVYYVIDSWTEVNIIAPLADILRANNYNILPVLRELLRSSHFFDSVNMSCMIKHPLDLVVGLCRSFAVPFPATDVVARYAMWRYLWSTANSVGMNIGDPPDVAGWKAYYQEPQYYETWINADTLTKRTAWTNRMASTGYSTSGAKIVIDPLAFVGLISVPSDPNILIDEAAQFLMGMPITASQKKFLKEEILIPGLPDYEWTAEWSLYVADPNNATARNAVKTKLQALLTFMMQMPEFQLM
ncbi:MAG: hypothetical protein H6Q32_1270 [Bacteroidetes bacterium]|nr:hypothetical protein [Bacteroidota bacterium]